MNLVECVPNYSEGRDKARLKEIIDSMKRFPVDVIDVEMNADHNRSVVTVVGEGEAVLNAVFESIKKASEIIDLNLHKGEHPRFGATDVVPFVPLLGTTMEYCNSLANKLGERVGRDLGIPVFLYGGSAKLPGRKELPAIRKAGFQYEQLRDTIEKDDNYIPDYGPRKLGSAGASIIGSREFLIAFNVDIRSEDLKGTKEIARRTREKTGVLKNVRALGFNLSETKETQVSMNLVNFKETGLPQVFEFVKREAEAKGLPVSRSELVGMIPLQAMEDIYRFYLKNPNFSQDQILEKKFLDIFMKDGMKGYLADLSSDKPAPGGGSASAMVGAMGAALVSMVAGLTIGKKGYEDSWQSMAEIRDNGKDVMWQLYNQAAKDTRAYENLGKALTLPRMTQEEKEARTKKVQETLKEATEVPYLTGEIASSMLDHISFLIQKGNKNAVSDVYCASLFISSSIYGSMQNVKINLGLIKDQIYVEEFKGKVAHLVERAGLKSEEIVKNMWT